MIDFKCLDGPDGLPIYFQRLPVRSVSIYWLVFVGSADDESVGLPGIYHWFEHIPSRGTRKYPGGYFDTEARLVRHGGSAGAETGYTHTSYYADVPQRVWKMALDILTDMIAQPLLRDEDIEAEREIIQQEIEEWHSSPYGESLCVLPSLLWPGHALGHDQLGSRKSLGAMSPSLLRNAHASGYARSRCVLFLVGDLDEEEVLAEVTEAIANLSARRLPERRGPASYGPLPAWKGGCRTVYPTKHDDSAIYLLFPLPAEEIAGGLNLRSSVLDFLITAGDLGSPLNRIVREQAQLAYAPEYTSVTTPDGGYWGLAAQSSGRHADRILDTFWHVLRSSEIRSPEWFDFVTDNIRGQFDMHDPSPGEYTEIGAGCLATRGHVWSDVELRSRLLSVKHAELIDYLDSLTTDDAHAIVFQGGRDI